MQFTSILGTFAAYRRLALEVFMDKAAALRALEQLEELTRGFGYPDESEKRSAKHLIFALRGTPLGADGYYLEKLGKLERCIDEGFSTRRFAKRPGGAEQVRVFALGAISTSRSLIKERWRE